MPGKTPQGQVPVRSTSLLTGLPDDRAAALAHYEFPPAMLRRLSAEHGWSPARTERAAHEYRRFLILAATAGHPVTPSQVVDKVWHEHLTFTRDYWERLQALLPAPLHHEPATGNASDADFTAQYRRTLESYARTFGEAAPADVWPAPAPRRPTAPAQVRGSARVPALLIATLAGVVAWLTFAWSSLAALIAFGVFVLALILAATAQARPGVGGPREEGSGEVLGLFDWSGGGSDGGNGSDGGSSCGSSCGGGCSS